jgi:adenine-specific DNA-methyltransferase
MEKRQLGIFYTPSEASRILCNWAIRTPHDLILEPSFGACGFLETSRLRLNELGSKKPIDNLFGCDIDPRAFSEFLLPKFDDTRLVSRFKEKDFLSLSPSEFPVDGFDAIIGNPPYVSHHNIPIPRKRALTDLIGSEINLDSKASLWAYFVIHSLRFLKVGGRIAWILPSSFLHADYAQKIRKKIAESFERSLIIQLGQHLFASEGTEESTAVLLAEGWKSGSTNEFSRVDFAATLLDLEHTIAQWQMGDVVGNEYDRRLGHILLAREAIKAVERIEERFEVHQLGDLAAVLIGIVTGANDFFVINEEIAKRWHLKSNNLTPILSRATFFDGIRITIDDLRKASQNNVRCLLLDTKQTNGNNIQLTSYLSSFPEDRKLTNTTFGKREVWHQPDDGRIPHAFLPYVLQHGPRLILNVANTTCTNSVHRVFFKDHVRPIEMKATAISILSTFSQLSAEVEGRTYGVGALKLEPSEAKRTKVILPSISSTQEVMSTFKRIDSLMRGGRTEEAKQLADHFVLGRYALRGKTLKVLREALQECRMRRFETAQVSKRTNIVTSNGR